MANYLTRLAGVKTLASFITTSLGIGDADKPIATNAQGKLDPSFLPTGVGPDFKNLEASENLSAGNAINIWDDGGTWKARRADNTARSKMCHGFVLNSYTTGQIAEVLSEGVNDQLSGLAPGPVYLSSTPGAVTQDPSTITTSGSIIQSLGVANGPNEIFVEVDYDPAEIA